MALLALRSMKEALLTLNDEGLELSENHIFEPEYHQDKYVSACTDVAKLPGSYQLGNAPGLLASPARGTQPSYADDENDPDSLVS